MPESSGTAHASIRPRQGAGKPFIVLLLAVVTVGVALSVSFWMGGIASLFSKHEQVEVSNAYASRLEGGGWIIVLKVRNTGSLDATIDSILVNGKELSAFEPGAVTITPNLPIAIQAGFAAVDIEVAAKAGTPGFMNGATVDLELRSSSGRRYVRTVMLL